MPLTILGKGTDNELGVFIQFVFYPQSVDRPDIDVIHGMDGADYMPVYKFLYDDFGDKFSDSVDEAVDNYISANLLASAADIHPDHTLQVHNQIS